jgi:hypothetical protein
LVTPNPVYALSPVSLSDTASGPGTLTYQWQTNSDTSGDEPPTGNWVNVQNATNLTQAFTPANSSSGGYTLNFQLIANNAAGSTTSSVVALVVNPAQAPASSTGVAPAAIATYPGATVSFTDASFVGTTPVTYQWQLNNGSGYANISSAQNPSATNTTLNLTNVQAAEAGSYQLVATSSQGSVNDSSVGIGTLTLLAPTPVPVSTSPQNVPYLEYSNAPYAYWRLQETNDPASAPPTVVAYDSSGHGFDGAYGTDVTTGNPGPEAPFYPGFSTNELAADTFYDDANGILTVPPLNLTSATNVSFIAWINPNQAEGGATGLLFNRNGNDASGFGFNGSPNGEGMPCLGFTWNSNSSATWGWNSGLYPVIGVWSFVAYVLTPTNETTYLFYVDTTVSPYKTNYLQSSIDLANRAEAFSVSSDLGGDPQSATRNFSGSIAEVALYTNSLSQQDVVGIFLAAIGSSVAPANAPTTLPSPSIFTGESIQIDGTAGGSLPISYQWKSSSDGVTWADVPANANYSGVTSPILQINDATLADALEYEVVASNSANTSTSAVSTVTVTAVPTGLWTMNFQVTNDTLNFSTSASGGGQYAGPGVLGGGTYWNCFVNTAGYYTSGTFYTASDFLDDGATESGVFASVIGTDNSTLSAPAPADSVSTLLDQFVFNATTLTFTGVPDGTYNLMIYAVDGAFESGGDYFAVNATNGVQTATTLSDQDLYFSQGDNSELFTNVQVAGGTLVVDVSANGGGTYDANINGAQLQLVSYATSITNVSLTYSVTNNTMTLAWPEGSLQTATNVAGPWVTLPDPSPTTVTTTNASQFYRLLIPAP